MYTVLGATGKTGSAVVKTLRERGAGVRAVVRDAARGSALAALGAELASAPYEDVGRLSAVFSNIQGAYVMLPPSHESPDILGDARRRIDAVAQALRTTQVAHVVLLSSVGAQHAYGTGILRTNHYAEKALRAVQSQLSILRAPYFMDNWSDALATAGEGIVTTMLPPRLSIPMIAAEDIGRIAAEVLLEGPSGTRLFELIGPRDYSADDVAQAFSRRLGRPVRTQHVPNADIPGMLSGFGVPASAAELFRELHEGIERGITVHEGTGISMRGMLTLEQAVERLLAGQRG